MKTTQIPYTLIAWKHLLQIKAPCPKIRQIIDTLKVDPGTQTNTTPLAESEDSFLIY